MNELGSRDFLLAFSEVSENVKPWLKAFRVRKTKCKTLINLYKIIRYMMKDLTERDYIIWNKIKYSCVSNE